MKRFLDFILVLSASLFLALPFHLLWVTVLATSKEPAIYRSKRVEKK
jgi:lipopolysaccharide/colanic/teichoic acid biosynthesis glycosyltransferase